ncbi:MAG: hypothetical protein HC780_08970 [Leptolyngbyaceae cyanobacterium CSU_1_3]|nr:hypothetical protein [Leptolyngbyaceae cyanobacterium CSU_1_3]
MALMKFEAFHSDYRNTAASDGFDIDDLKNFSVYAEGEDKVDSVCREQLDVDIEGRPIVER